MFDGDDGDNDDDDDDDLLWLCPCKGHWFRCVAVTRLSVQLIELRFGVFFFFFNGVSLSFVIPVHLTRIIVYFQEQHWELEQNSGQSWLGKPKPVSRWRSG